MFFTDGTGHQENIPQEQHENQHIYGDVLQHQMEDSMKRSEKIAHWKFVPPSWK